MVLPEAVQALHYKATLTYIQVTNVWLRLRQYGTHFNGVPQHGTPNPMSAAVEQHLVNFDTNSSGLQSLTLVLQGSSCLLSRHGQT